MALRSVEKWEGFAYSTVRSGSLGTDGLSSPDRTLGGRYQAEASLCHSQWSPRCRIGFQEISLLNSKITGDSILGFLSVQTIPRPLLVDGTAPGSSEKVDLCV